MNMNSSEVSFNSNSNSNNNNNNRRHHSRGINEQQKLTKVNQLPVIITAAQSHDRLPMVSTDSDSSGYPRSDNYSIVTIDDEVKRIKLQQHNNIEDANLMQIKTNSSCQDETLVKSRNFKHRTRFIIALLGLTIAVVNCYAQATFCISIVEMVLPSDYVFKGESGDNSVVKLVAGSTTGVIVPATQQTAHNDQETIDYSCPVEYRYRDYYDSWRFPSPESSKNLTSQQQQQPISRSSTSNSFIDTSNRFDWDASRQGLLLGAFAIGTAPLQILGGRLAEIYGAKWVLLAGCIGTALTNLTIPFLAHFSFTMLILNRITMGVAQAGMEPGLMCLLAEWLTPAETGFFISMLLFAICIGFFLGSLCSSFLLTLGYGWPITYYVAGGMNLVVAIVWFIYANSRPRESKLISADELKYIESEQQYAKSMEKEVEEKETNNDLTTTTTNQSKLMQQNISNKTTTGNACEILSSNPNCSEQINFTQMNQFTPSTKLNKLSNDNVLTYDNANKTDKTIGKGQAPWNNILKTPSVWAFIICKISIRWCADVLAIELPTYLANVLHLSIKLNGILNSVSSALFAICSFITGYLVNELLKDHHRSSDSLRANTNLTSTSIIVLARKQQQQQQQQQQISKTNLRKLMQSIASFGSAICVFLMTQYDCNIMFSMSMLLILSCCLVMGTGGELQIPYDMTSRYPGTLHGMACTLSVSGWLAPPLIGLILGDQPSSRYRWSLVWYLTALINLIGGLVFVLFADASPRDFDRQGVVISERERRTSIENISENLGSGTKRKISKNKKEEEEEEEEEEENKKKKKLKDLKKQFKVEDKTIESVEQEVGSSERGRHLMSYYNIACKSSDTSPPRKRPNQLEEERSTLKQQQQQQDLSWSSYFDRDLIRIRQIEDSFIKPGYLNNFDSIAQTQTMIFPYHTNEEEKKETLEEEEAKRDKSCCSYKNSGIVNLKNNNEYASNLVTTTTTTTSKLDKQQILLSSKGSLIWRLWSRVPNISGRKRRKFSFDGEEERKRSKVGQKQEEQIRTKRSRREVELDREEFESSINSVILPDVLAHSRKQGVREKSTRPRVSREEEIGIDAVSTASKRIFVEESELNSSIIMRREGDGETKAREELYLEKDGNQQLVQSTAASNSPFTSHPSTIATNAAPVVSMIAPLASKTITHL